MSLILYIVAILYIFSGLVAFGLGFFTTIKFKRNKNKNIKKGKK